jgi:dTDP-4-amino-4,6-dideoxygalactose transaminase
MIPFVDLKAQFAHLEKEIRLGIDAVLKHGRFIMGPEVTELEEQLADFAGSKYAVTCSSGTDALLMALMAAGIGEGDVVFTTPFTFIATAEVISLLGAVPVFVDIDPRTFDIDPAKLESAIQAVQQNDPSLAPLPKGLDTTNVRPKAVIPVDLFGLPADYDAINKVAAENNLFVLEDAAQGFGGIYKGKQAGTLGHAGAVSFFPAKPLGCYGDGGAIFTDDEKLAERLVSIRVHGKGTEKYDNVRIGLNGRLDTLQAAILLPKLRAFPQEIKSRQRVADKYTEQLASAGDALTLPFVPQGLSSVWAQYSILCDNRGALQKGLKEAGVPSMIYYPKPLHLQSAYDQLGYTEGDYPVAESCSKKIVSLPMHPYLEENVIEDITQSVLANI